MNVSLSWIGPANENETLSAQEPEQTRIDLTMTAVSLCDVDNGATYFSGKRIRFCPVTN
jgi:hypothetical protein